MIPQILLDIQRAFIRKAITTKRNQLLFEKLVKLSKVRGVDLWTTVRRSPAMFLLPPEMVATPRYDTLAKDGGFPIRTRAFGVDEVHLCNFWGEKF